MHMIDIMIVHSWDTICHESIYKSLTDYSNVNNMTISFAYETLAIILFMSSDYSMAHK